MNGNSAVCSPGNLRLQPHGLFLVLCFCLFLYPISIEGESANLSVNYSFLLFPVACALLSGRIRKPPDIFLLFMAFYILVFVFATLLQYQLLHEWTRRSISFVLFMSMFAFMFVTIDDRTIEAFKAAVIIAAIGFSVYTIALFFSSGDLGLDYELAKNEVGTQRIGFIHIMAFWILYMAKPRSIAGHLVKHIATLPILVGLALTFSRSSIIALGGSLLAFSLFGAKEGKRFAVMPLFKRITISGMAVLVALLLMVGYFPIVLEFFDARLVQFFLTTELVQGNLADQATSEGTRIFIWQSILEYVALNPITGSGYLGVWILDLFGSGGGSAHNQYLDVLYRVGIIGFLIHLFLLYRTAVLLRLRDQGLFWGFAGVIIYGCFHETFKESQGGFILAFLLGMMSQREYQGLSAQKVKVKSRWTNGPQIASSLTTLS